MGSPTVLVASAVLVVALLVAALLTIGGKGDAKAEAPTTLVTAPPTTVGEAAATTTTAARQPGAKRYVTITKDGPGSDVSLATTRARIDAFSSGPDVGSYPGHGKFEVLSGFWRILHGQMTVTGSAERTPLLVTFDPGAADLTVQVDVPQRTNGSGIAFRVKDARNYFAWTTVPQFSAVSLVRVVDGKETVLLGASPAKAGSGVPTLGIHLTPTGVDLLYRGGVVATYDDLPSSPAGTHLGLVTSEPGAVAAFDNLRLLVA